MANRKFRSPQDIELWLNFATSALNAALSAEVSEAAHSPEKYWTFGELQASTVITTAFEFADFALVEAYERMSTADYSDWREPKSGESN